MARSFQPGERVGCDTGEVGDSKPSVDVPTVLARPTPRPEGAPQVTITMGAPTEAPGAFETGWAEANRYALISELARGGGGKITIAIDRKLGRRVALKRPLDADGGARLEREAFVLARLQHPSIVPIHDAGHDPDGAPFYTMKLIDGETLAARVARATSFDARLTLLAAVTSVAEAMAYAHAQGVIHRDLKPGNVVIGEFGEVAVIDWGLGKLVDDAPDELATGGGAASELTGHDSVVGTPAYMAPEQARGALVDRRADVYALGAMLYHVLSGKLPYAEADAATTLVHLQGGPPPPSVDVREPRVPRDLAAIVSKAMARDLELRYPNAAELAEDLRRYQNGRLVAAHRYRVWTRAWRWLRRHRARVAIGTGALALSVAAAAVVWVSRQAVAAEVCTGVDAPALAAWNAEVAAPIERAFLASGVPQAVATWRTVAAALGAHTQQIAGMRTAACRATRITGEQSAEALDLRMTCLDRRTDELRNLVASLRSGDRATVEHAVEGVASLGRVADCADLARLRDVMPMPADPVSRATIAAIENDLDRTMATARLGKFVEVDRALPAIVARAEATGYEPVRARALWSRAKLLVLQTRTAELVAAIDQALAAAERAGTDRLRADILTLRLHVELNTLEHVDLAATLAEQVKAIGERVHEPEVIAAALGYMSQIDYRRDRPDDAVRHAEQALAVLPSPEGEKGWPAQARLAAAYVKAHRPADARRIYERLVASRRAVIGDADDPNLANNLANLAAVHDQAGDHARALELMTEAAAMLRRTLPADARPRMAIEMNLAVLHNTMGQHADARRELLALLPITEAKLGHDHSSTADLVFRIAETHEGEHHLEDALAGYRDALARYTAAKVPRWIAKSHGHIGVALLRLGRPAEARPELELALAAMTELHGAESPEAAIWRGDLGRVYGMLGDPRAAIRELERALASLDREGDAELHERGLYRAQLAMSYWQLGDRPKALELAKLARAQLEQAGPEAKDPLDELTAWERARR